MGAAVPEAVPETRQCRRSEKYNFDIRESHAPLEVRLFGGFDVLIDGKPMLALRSRREGWLLALLILRHGSDTSREWLASTLWPDNAEEQALFYLRKGLSNLRKALGEEAGRLQSPTPRTLRFDDSGAVVDVVAFDRASDPAEMVVLYGGPLLPDCHEEWAVLERGRRELAYFESLERLAAESEPVVAVRWLRLLVAADPYRESAYRALMQALAACGDAAAVTAVYRELRERLYQLLNAEPSAETEGLYRQLSQEVRPVAPVKVEVRETGRHLPVPLSDLIGREAEIAEVLDWLGQRRLVTLVGAGGIGKTRLAIAAAEAALPRFADGVWFVDLAALADPALVASAAAKALGVAEEHHRPAIESLTEGLAGRSMLVVLDNCEHLAEACAEFGFQLLSTCPMVSILATSRQALNVVGEQVYRVPSLAVPAEDEEPQALMGYEAVRLFVDRALRVDSGFRLSQRNAKDVVAICRELDGIALAIEMAAARLRSLSVGEIRTRLNDRFRLLKSGNRGALPRQHTLRAAIDWSYDHLSEAEREVLRRVSVFSGGWTLEAAEAIAEDEIDVEEVLSSLVDKSLVVAEVRDERTRYRLLETVRQYGQYRLLESEQHLAARTRHRDYYLTYALEMRPKLMGADQAHWFAVLDAEHDNLRQALRFCLEQPDGGQPGLRLAGALSRFWMVRGYFSEGREWFLTVAAHPSAQERTTDRAIALNGAGLLAWRQSDYPAAVAIYEESLSIAREVDSRLDIARALNNLALITRDLGNYDSARVMHEESIEIFRENGERLITAICLSNLGVVTHYQGDFAAARAAFEEGLVVQRELGDRSGTLVTLGSLGAVAMDEGDVAYARRCHEEGLAIAEELEDKYGYASHLNGLGRALGEQGDWARGWSMIQESLERMAAVGERTVVTDYFMALGSLARKMGRPREAATLFAIRAALRDVSGSPLPDYMRLKIETELASLRENLGSAAFDEAWQVGSGMSMEQALPYALGLAAE